MAASSTGHLAAALLAEFGQAQAAVHRGDTRIARDMLKRLWDSSAGHGGSLDETVERTLIGIATVTQSVLLVMDDTKTAHEHEHEVHDPMQAAAITALANNVVQSAEAHAGRDSLVVWSKSMCAPSC